MCLSVGQQKCDVAMAGLTVREGRMEGLLQFINGLGNAGRRRRVNNHIVNIAVQQILNRQRAVLVPDHFHIEAVKAPIRVALRIKLAGGSDGA